MWTSMHQLGKGKIYRPKYARFLQTKDRNYVFAHSRKITCELFKTEYVLIGSQGFQPTRSVPSQLMGDVDDPVLFILSCLLWSCLQPKDLSLYVQQLLFKLRRTTEGQTVPFTYILTTVIPLSFICKDVSIAKPSLAIDLPQNSVLSPSGYSYSTQTTCPLARFLIHSPPAEIESRVLDRSRVN